MSVHRFLMCSDVRIYNSRQGKITPLLVSKLQTLMYVKVMVIVGEF